MLDLISVKQNSNLLSITTHDTSLRKVASSGGGEWAGPCPFCGGRDRFRVQPYQQRWLCRNCSDGKWRDVIEYVSRRNNLDVHKRLDLEAICRFAIGYLPVSINKQSFHPVIQPTKATKPPLAWQKRALTFIGECEKTLWTADSRNALEYLHNRGLNEKTITAWHLGYNPIESFEPLSEWGLEQPDDGARHSVWLPEGITIPCVVNHETWYIKVKRLGSEPKYINVKGGHPALFGADHIINNDIAVLTEGEFDAMLLWQEVGNIIGVGTLGSSTNIPDLTIWGQTLSSPELLFAAYDADEAGMKGHTSLVTALNSVIPLQVPVLRVGDKDITDFYLSGGDLRTWIMKELTLEDEY